MTRPLVLLVLIAIFGLLTWNIWKSTRPQSASVATIVVAPALDPRLTYETPYRNVRPEVKYVGSQACAACHRGVCASYRDHPMGRSMSLVSQASRIERYDAAAHNPFEKFGFDFQVEHQGNRFLHKTSKRDSQGNEAISLTREVQYVVGSGVHGRTYLASLDNYLFQTPINWFSHARRWDMAPNIGATHGGNLYPAVAHLCIYCHANAAEPIVTSRNHYRSALAQPLAIVNVKSPLITRGKLIVRNVFLIEPSPPCRDAGFVFHKPTMPARYESAASRSICYRIGITD